MQVVSLDCKSIHIVIKENKPSLSLKLLFGIDLFSSHHTKCFLCTYFQAFILNRTDFSSYKVIQQYLFSGFYSQSNRLFIRVVHQYLFSGLCSESNRLFIIQMLHQCLFSGLCSELNRLFIIQSASSVLIFRLFIESSHLFFPHSCFNSLLTLRL